MKTQKMIKRQIVAPLQQWLLEQGICLACGRQLAKIEKANGRRQKVSCPCGESYAYLPKTKIYKRLAASKYV